jgi:glutamate N-acetyltransferase/amino-acid N-acetyltransferase
VLVCQTGLIGIPMPMDPVRRGIGMLLGDRGADAAAAARAARAIMTTDTVPKEAVVAADGFTVGAMAKGAAMLAPDMATMLAVLTTDAMVAPDVLQRALHLAVGPSFNRLTVDGCTSTNDTVVVLASGAAGASPTEDQLAESLGRACASLAEQMAADAEGATKVAVVRVEGARDEDQAHRAARKVAESQLVQCSLNGADPYWGRVVSELGSAGVDFDLDRVEVAYGGTVVCRDGVAAEHDAAAVAAHMAGARIDLTCRLGLGTGSAAILTTDLGYGYIDENRTTS